MANNETYPSDYIWAAFESVEAQLAVLDAHQVSPLVEKYFLRNLLISLHQHFGKLDAKTAGPAWNELRDAVELLLHDSKAPVSRSYLDEMVSDLVAELVPFTSK